MLFFLDYYEGVLPEGQREELMRFLDAHADLKVEFYDFEIIQLEGDKGPKYPDKDMLKKKEGLSGVVFDVNADNYESCFVAYVEGDLAAADAAAVESFAASDEKYGRELRLMQLTKLQADENIRFPRKPALKRHFVGTVPRRKWHYTSAAAAVLLLAALVYSLFPVLDQTYIAEETPVAGDQEAPEAVAAIPVPQQDPTTLIAEAEDVISRAAVGGLSARTPVVSRQQPDYARSYIGGPVALDLATLRGTADTYTPQRPASMPGRPVERLVAEATVPPPTPELREDFIWLAYRDPQDNPLIAMESPEPAQVNEVGLGSFVLSRIGQRTGVDRVLADVTDESNPLLGMAGEGISRIAPAAGNALGIETVRDESGRLIRLAVGDGFAITRR